MATKASSRKRSAPWATALGIVLLFVAGCWFFFHLQGRWKALSLVAAFPVALQFVQFAFGKKLTERWQHTAATSLQRFLREPRTLLIGWAVFAVMALSYSTLVVLPDPDGGKVRVAVGPAGRDPGVGTQIGGEDALRQGVFFPLGRLFTVRAAGYGPKDVRVYPVVLRKVRLGEDILPLPSVLLRPPSRALVSLAMGGAYEIVDAGSGNVVAQGKVHEAHALLLGGAGMASDDDRLRWGSELPPDPEEHARVLEAWKQPFPVSMEIRPGTQLEARIRDPDGSLIASARFEVPATFGDILMQEVSPP